MVWLGLKTFREFRSAGENAYVAKDKLVDRIIELLTVHTYIENEVMYPRVRALLPDVGGTTCSSPTKSIMSPTSSY